MEPPDIEIAQESAPANGDALVLQQHSALISQDALKDKTRAGSSIVKPQSPMEALLKSGGGATHLKLGELAGGTVLEQRGNRIYIDLGPDGTGVIFGREYYAAGDLVKNLSSGDPIHAKVVDTDNEDGYVELSLKEAGDEKRWVNLKKFKDEGTPLELQPIEANRGGLLIELEGIRGFLPASQLSLKHYPRVEGGDKEKIFQELKKLVGGALKLRVLDVDQKEGKLIFTEKGADSEEMAEVLAKYKVGDVVEGVITGVVDFGAFMKFGDERLEGLIHISEIDWTLIEDPRTILKPGDTVPAKIIEIQEGKISLSLKALREDPWRSINETYNKGDIVTGRVTKINPFGAFVQIDKDFHGLAHVSEFGSEDAMQEKLALNETYDFRILLIDPAEHRLLLGFGKEEENTANEDQKIAEIPIPEAKTNE